MSKDSEEDYRRLIEGDPGLGLIATAPRQHRKRLAAALRIELESAQEAGMLGYQARLLVQCRLPYRQQLMNEWTRTNGNPTFTLFAPKAIGLPYGVYPCLILTWVTTEAVRKHQRVLDLDESMTSFIRAVGINAHATGPQIQRFKEQLRRLFATTIMSSLEDANFFYDTGFRLASELYLWWDPATLAVSGTPARVVLTEEFYRAITDRPVPTNLEALKALKGSALALDIYCWLVYRLSYLKQPTTIPWELLQMQFGSEYAATRSGRYAFKKDFQTQLREVITMYPAAKVTADQQQGITLYPSPLAISRQSK